jgi:predicted nicotinamide N-methyase
VGEAEGAARRQTPALGAGRSATLHARIRSVDKLAFAMTVNPNQAGTMAPEGLSAFGQRLECQRPPLCPEIGLWLLPDEIDLELECRTLSDCQPPPYWAFCWGSGQALARYLLDHPDEVRGRQVVDFGSGCGVAAIAAAMVGAATVVAVDCDASARRAICANALHNHVEVTVAEQIPDDWDVMLASDVLYESANRDWLLAAPAPGRKVIISDPERPSSPPLRAELAARYAARTLPDADSPMCGAAVFALQAADG